MELTPRLRHTFRALRHRDFRVFWIGQWISVTGTWMQSVAQGWLVYRLTDSPLALGLLSLARFGPSLFGSPFAGVITDRFPRRGLVQLTQALSLAQAAALAALTLTGTVRLWHILMLAVFQGIVDTLDMPARQTLQMDLVGLDDLQSAVSLNSSAFNAGRMVGPAVAGVLVAVLGEGICFAVNAASYLAVLLALLTIHPRSEVTTPAHSVVADLLEGVQYAWREPRVRAVLFAVAVTSLLGLSYSTLLPVLARDVLHAGAQGYGALLAGAGLGAMAGALGAASRRGARGTGRVIALSQATLGIGLMFMVATRSVVIATACMVVIGLGVSVQLSTTNGFLQTTTPAPLRGRVVSLYIWLFAGLSPLGGLAVGWSAEHLGTVWIVAGAGAACLLSAVVTTFEIPIVRRALQG